jgi:hypothetical protein
MDDATLARLGHLNFLAFYREQSLLSDRGRVLEADGALLHASGTDLAFLFNAVHRTDPDRPATEVLATADEFFGALGRGYTVYAWPGDDDLADAALAAGFQEFGGSPEMVCRARLDDADPPPGVELREVTDVDAVEDFLVVGTGAFATLGMPPHAMVEAMDRPERLLAPHWRTVLAVVDGEPAAAALTLLSHGIAGVYWVSTLPSHRGRGLGELVTRWVTNAAFDLGARAQTLQASAMGEPIYARMGYETLHRYRNFVKG